MTWTVVTTNQRMKLTLCRSTSQCADRPAASAAIPVAITAIVSSTRTGPATRSTHMRRAFAHVRLVPEVVAGEAVADARELRDDERGDDHPDEHVRGEQIVDTQDRDALDGEEQKQRARRLSR